MNTQPLPSEAPSGKFFRKIDWFAFGTTFIITLAAYIVTLAPTVTLEDSGELVVAADYLGVPHPPGYPIWTLIAWFFQWVFHGVTYYGQPNPAWAVGFMSAFFGASACAILALLVSRSGYDILRSIRSITDALGTATESLLCWVGGVSGGLLFAFSSVLWSQSVIVEVYSLNAFFLALILLLTYRWMCRPHEDAILYIVAFLFGLGLTNHQSLLFAIPGLVVAIAFRDIRLFRDCMAGGLWCIAILLFYKAHSLGGPTPSPEDTAKASGMIQSGISLIFIGGGFALIQFRLMTEWKRFIFLASLVALGLSFYLYLPIASDQNPPMNWGYPRTEEGFWHALSRGQYEKIAVLDNFKHAIANPAHFIKLVRTIVFDFTGYTSVISEFTWPIAIVGLLAFGFLWQVNWSSASWFIVTLVAFLSMTVVFVVFQYPDLDVQTLFIGRVQYIQAHAIYALWISYGLVFALAWIDAKLQGSAAVKYAGIILAFLLPLVLIARNAFDDDYLKLSGGVEQNGHDFGWQFGHYQLRGVDAILEEIDPEEPPPPSTTYPPQMGTNAVFFGGTDPGRFVPTYMIYSAKVRSDVYLITQNALADNTYMSVMRDLYGDSIWIPSLQDSNAAFRKYVDDVRAGRIPPGASVVEKDGRVSVQGVQGVMMINGILSKYIFDHNKEKHDFYVEESYVIPWMYPYLTPHGLIMKINQEPLSALPADVVQDDHKFWEWYTKRLTSNKKFLRDVVARKTFSKLRSALGGLYVYRRNLAEAEYAFGQAIELYDLSPEANFRLADVYMQQAKFQDAINLIEGFLLKDEDNEKVRNYLKQLQNMQKRDLRRQELEPSLQKGADLATALELLKIYRELGRISQFENLGQRLISDPRIPTEVYAKVGKLAAQSRRFNLSVTAYTKMTERAPNNYEAWIELAAGQWALRQPPEMVKSLQQAVATGGEPARADLRKDPRFNSVRSTPVFQQLVPPPRPNHINFGFGKQAQ